MDNVRDDVKDYYGKVLAQKDDLKTNACCTPGGLKMPAHMRKAAANVCDEVVRKYYGCGLVIPSQLNKMRVLDLGSGSGRDCYILAQLVGSEGHVTGIDMTEEQLSVARKYEDEHAEKFGYEQKNTSFVCGYIERLRDAGLEDNTFDVIVSNCVVNLSPDKKAVLSEAYRVLKEGGELYFSDVYSDQILPEDIRKHKVLWGECIAGALCWTQLHDLAEEVGFSPPRLVTSDVIGVNNPELQKVVDGYKFVSVTYRLFKLPLERRPASRVVYEGGIVGFEDELKFDYQTNFKTTETKAVSSELATILYSTRYRDYFTFHSIEEKNECADPAEEARLDPIALAHASTSDSGCCAPPATTGGGCCAPPATTGGGCCAPPATTGGGCCAPPATTGGGCCAAPPATTGGGCCAAPPATTGGGCCAPSKVSEGKDGARASGGGCC